MPANVTVERPEPGVVSDETNDRPAEPRNSQCVTSGRVDHAELGLPRQVRTITLAQNPEYVPMKMESARSGHSKETGAGVFGGTYGWLPSS